MCAAESVLRSTDVMYIQNRHVHTVSSMYKVDFWREVKKRWMVLGVLCAIALAVLSPEAGAPGGVLRAQSLSHAPRSYIYYSAGRRTRARALLSQARRLARAHALCCVHSLLVAPALCALVLTAFKDGVDYRIVKGAMLSSACGGCAWLSLAVCGGAGAPTACACAHVASLLLAPLLCGAAAAPSLWTLAADSATALAPFAVGVCRAAPARRRDATATKVSALLLVYAECCERLCAAAGALRVADVLATLLLVSCWLTLMTLCIAACGRWGPLAAEEVRLVYACALPKALHYWQDSATCSLTGLARLPPAFLAPAQALFLAAMAPDEEHDCETDPHTDGTLIIPYDNNVAEQQHYTTITLQNNNTLEQ